MAQETLIATLKSELAKNRQAVIVNESYGVRDKSRLAMLLKDERLGRIPLDGYSFLVAPADPIIPDDVESLNRFLEGITSQEPSNIKPFSMQRGRLRVGHLYFQETLLTQRIERSIEVFNDTAVRKAHLLSSNLFGAKARKQAGLRQRSLTGVEERHFVRDIYISLFPSAELARLYLAHDEEVLLKEMYLAPDERDKVRTKLYLELHDLIYEVRPKRIKAIKAGQPPFPEISQIPELQALVSP